MCPVWKSTQNTGGSSIRIGIIQIPGQFKLLFWNYVGDNCNIKVNSLMEAVSFQFCLSTFRHPVWQRCQLFFFQRLTTDQAHFYAQEILPTKVITSYTQGFLASLRPTQESVGNFHSNIAQSVTHVRNEPFETLSTLTPTMPTSDPHTLHNCLCQHIVVLHWNLVLAWQILVNAHSGGLDIKEYHVLFTLAVVPGRLLKPACNATPYVQPPLISISRWANRSDVNTHSTWHLVSFGRQYRKIGKSKNGNSLFSIKDIHCQWVLTYL